MSEEFKDMMPTSEEVYWDDKLTQYETVVEMVCECIEDVSEDNGVGFETNLSLYLEGLECDVIALKSIKNHQD